MKIGAQHRSWRPSQPVSPSSRARSGWPHLRATALLAALVFASGAGCATSHHGRPRALALAGTGLALAGTTVWVVGENRSDPGHLPTIGLGVVIAGVVAMVAAGGWIAAQVSCEADPDCDETEECREVPAPPGGVPYKQCVPR